MKNKKLGGVVLLGYTFGDQSNLLDETHLRSCQSERRAGYIKPTALTCVPQHRFAYKRRLLLVSNVTHSLCPQTQPCISARTSLAIPSSCFASCWVVAKPSRTTQRSSCSLTWAPRCRRSKATSPWTVHEPAGEERAARRTTEAVSGVKGRILFQRTRGCSSALVFLQFFQWSLFCFKLTLEKKVLLCCRMCVFFLKLLIVNFWCLEVFRMICEYILPCVPLAHCRLFLHL